MLFPEFYDKEKGLLDFGENYQYLKGDIAEITEDMKEDNKKIRFFDDTNPSWRRGTELPCIGEVCLATLLRFFRKQLIRRNAVA
jgi:hypothetical protein